MQTAIFGLPSRDMRALAARMGITTGVSQHRQALAAIQATLARPRRALRTAAQPPVARPMTAAQRRARLEETRPTAESDRVVVERAEFSNWLLNGKAAGGIPGASWGRL